jgi:hypothetical protein
VRRNSSYLFKEWYDTGGVEALAEITWPWRHSSRAAMSERRDDSETLTVGSILG